MIKLNDNFEWIIFKIPSLSLTIGTMGLSRVLKNMPPDIAAADMNSWLCTCTDSSTVSVILIACIMKTVPVCSQLQLTLNIQQCSTHLTATRRHLRHGFTQCYLPPNTSERAPPNPSHKGWYSINLPWRDGRLSWHRWLVTYWDG